MRTRFFYIILFLLGIPLSSFAQYNTAGQEVQGDVNTITTAVPFLSIPADSRSGAMGDAGVASLPDANSQHHNAAKYLFLEQDFGLSISYTPWLRKPVDDINLAYISGYKKYGKDQVLSTALRYFSLGNIVFTDEVGNATGQYNPNEFAFDIGYTRRYSPNLSGAVTMRYISSSLTGGQYVGGTSTHPGRSVAADLGVYYHKALTVSEKKSILTLGGVISNIGSKISYTADDVKNFIPTMLKLGAGLSMDLDDYNTVAITGEVRKLLVPTPPVYSDSVRGEIEYGMNPNVSVPVGMVQSFYDAPGVQMDPLNPDDRSVFREEMHEINYSIGFEYWYAKQFAVRAGYFYEHPTKGNRQFFTVGLGMRLNVFGLDFSYLIPTYQQNPLENTLRFTLVFNFAGLTKDKQNAKL